MLASHACRLVPRPNYPCGLVARGNAVRNRSESGRVSTPSGPCDRRRAAAAGRRLDLVLDARRAGNVDWDEARTPAEAILLPARKPQAWLREAAATAERQLVADDRLDDERPSDRVTPGTSLRRFTGRRRSGLSRVQAWLSMMSSSLVKPHAEFPHCEPRLTPGALPVYSPLYGRGRGVRHLGGAYGPFIPS